MSTILRLCTLALSCAMLASACSSSASAEEYFADLELATTTLDGELDAIEADFNGGLLDIDFEAADAETALIGLFQNSISSTAASFETLLEGLEELDPPDEITASHDDVIEAGQRVITTYDERSEELASIDELADIDAYAQALADSGVRGRYTEACLELQAQADQAGIPADLGC